MRVRLAPLLCAGFLSACASVGMGPVVDLDWCARGLVDEAQVLRDLHTRAAQPTPMASLSFATPRPTKAPASTAPVPGAPPPTELLSLELKLPMDAPVMAFPGGPSRVAAVALPDPALAVQQVVVVPGLSGFTLRQALDCSPEASKLAHHVRARRLIDPQITFLGADRRPLGAPDEGEPTVHRTQGAKRFKVPAPARYFVLHYDASRLGQPFALAGSTFTTMMPAGGLFVPMPVDGSISGIRTSTGVVTVAFER